MRKNSLKSLLTIRLKDIYIQTLDTYCQDSLHLEKCKIINACQTDLYKATPYLSQLRSANVRFMFTKMRIDANCTMNSQPRSFRNTKTKDPSCKECHNVQLVTQYQIHLCYSFLQDLWILTHVLPWQPDVRFSSAFSFAILAIICSFRNYLPQFYIFYHFLIILQT